MVMTRALAADRTGPMETLDIARLKRRDPGAWTALFERDYAAVFRAALGQVGEPAVAEDIAGQVFLEALEGIGRYRDRGRPLTAWLMTIARHRALDWFRKRSRERGSEIEPTSEGPEAGLTVAVDALARLTADQREVIHFRFVEGYSLEEVATMTGRSTGAVKSLQHRGLARLRTFIGEDGHA